MIDWLEEFDERPYGAKTQAVKEALRRGMGADWDQATDTTPALDLAQLRQVVEAALETALARQALAPRGEGASESLAPAAEDEETEALLDVLGEALVVED